MNQRLLAVNIGDAPINGSGGTLSGTYPQFSVLLNLLLKNSLTIIGIIMLVLLISGGLMFIIGAGSQDSKKSAQAKSVITDALIGFAVVFLAYFIIQIIEVITGVNILNSGL